MRWPALVLCLAAGAALAQPAPPAAVNDYPTSAWADYIFGCIAVNGQTQDALARCSCSIDQIASILPYGAYVEAETVLRMRFAPASGGRCSEALRRSGPSPPSCGGRRWRRRPSASEGAFAECGIRSRGAARRVAHGSNPDGSPCQRAISTWPAATHIIREPPADRRGARSPGTGRRWRGRQQ
jgi:hypothetical protein